MATRATAQQGPSRCFCPKTLFPSQKSIEPHRLSIDGHDRPSHLLSTAAICRVDNRIVKGNKYRWSGFGFHCSRCAQVSKLTDTTALLPVMWCGADKWHLLRSPFCHVSTVDGVLCVILAKFAGVL